MLSDYLPAPLLQSSVTVHSFDACGGAARRRAGSAGRAWRGGVNFDCILLDAPCSSERHVMRRCGAAAENWSKGRLRRDAKTQLRLIDTALSLLNPEGGRLVFSTCSIDPGQNDEVMSKVLKSHGAAVELLPPLLHLTETGIGAGHSVPAADGDDWFCASSRTKNVALLGACRTRSPPASQSDETKGFCQHTCCGGASRARRSAGHLCPYTPEKWSSSSHGLSTPARLPRGWATLRACRANTKNITARAAVLAPAVRPLRPPLNIPSWGVARWRE